MRRRRVLTWVAAALGATLTPGGAAAGETPRASRKDWPEWAHRPMGETIPPPAPGEAFARVLIVGSDGCLYGRGVTFDDKDLSPEGIVKISTKLRQQFELLQVTRMSPPSRPWPERDTRAPLFKLVAEARARLFPGRA